MRIFRQILMSSFENMTSQGYNLAPGMEDTAENFPTSSVFAGRNGERMIVGNVFLVCFLIFLPSKRKRKKNFCSELACAEATCNYLLRHN